MLPPYVTEDFGYQTRFVSKLECPVLDHAPFLENIFDFDPGEHSYPVEEIEGDIPDFVRGTYYINGPGRFERGGLRYQNWLDGDGMVCAIRFEPGRVHFANRFVRCTKFIAEEAAQRPIFRTFGTAFQENRLKRNVMLESPVNVSVYSYAGMLLAFGEQSLPWQLDPVTLETRGPFNFSGALNEVSPFAAHPKFDVRSGEMFNFGVSFSATQPQLHLFRFDAHARQRTRKRLNLEYPCSVHDFCLSPTYAVFYLSPYLLDMSAIRNKGQSLIEALRWEPQRGSRLLIVQRETGQEVASIAIGQGYCLHLINSFEDGENLTVDVVEYVQPVYDQYGMIPNLFTNVSSAQPVRFVVDVRNWALIERSAISYRLAHDFPSIDARHVAQPYRDVWMLGMSGSGQRGRKFFDQLVHADWHEPTTTDTYQAPAACYLGGEPRFIARPDDSRAGVVICQLIDARQGSSAFAMFDALHVARGPVALLKLREPIPPLFHTMFEAR